MVDVVRLPNDPAAERSVLGAMVLDPSACVGVLEIVEVEDFYVEAHKIFYQACVELVREERPCDLVVLTNKLREEGLLERVGGASYLSYVMVEFPDLANVEHYARIVRDKSVKRQLMGVCLSVLTMGEMDSGTAEEMVQDAQEGVYRLAEAVSTSVPVSVGEVAPARVELARKLARGEIEAVGLPMGWRELDVLTGGLHAGEVTMLAACTSVGKSSFAIDLSRRVSERGERVLFVSLEMSKANLADKVLACKAQVNSHAFRKAKFPLFTVDRVGSTPDERLTIAEQQLVGSTMMLWDETGVTPMRLRTRCRQMRAEGKLDLVVLDYVQLMEPDGKHRQQHEGYQEISRALKRLAGDLEIPILVCAQLNRSADKRDKNGKLIDPLLSEIGGSTSFEKDAHNVLFLSRDVSERQEITKVILAKSRMGETGTRRLMFNMAESRFCQVGSWES